MSLKVNILANYASQIYVAVVGIVVVPIYIRYMGSEAYGLVGFFAMLQSWFQLLDLGLAPTIARETARYGGGGISALMLRRLLRTLEGVFFTMAVAGCIGLLLSSEAISTRWLKAEQLPVWQVRDSVQLMAGIVALRWISGLYRGAIGGFEKQVWLGSFNIAIATARFLLVLVIFEALGTTPRHFFSYQLLIACIETVILVGKTYSLMPPIGNAVRVPWSFDPLKGVIKFSLGIAFTSSVWVFVTQTDKLILSKMLPLSEYAYFTLAVLVAGGISIMSGPVSNALLPRLSRLNAAGDHAGLLHLYRKSTQLVAAIVVPTAAVMAYFAGPLLQAWTGSLETAKYAAPVLRLYVLGNAILAIGAFPYYMQFAKGDIRLHMVGNLLFVVLLIPSIILATYWHGAIGAGWVWLSANALYFLLWVPIVHKRFAPGLHVRWLTQDIFPVVVTVVPSVALAAWLISMPQGRKDILLVLASIGCVALLMGACSLSSVRLHIRRQLFGIK